MSDSEAIEALALELKHGDDQALDGLMERFGSPVHSFVFRHVGNVEDALELTQEVFVRVHRSIGKWEPRAPFQAWLFRIALNLCRDHAKSRAVKQRRRTITLDEGLEPSSPLTTPDVMDQLMNQDDLAQLDAMIRELPEKLREPLILVALEGFSSEEAASVLKLSVRAVESRVYRARVRLRERWER